MQGEDDSEPEAPGGSGTASDDAATGIASVRRGERLAPPKLLPSPGFAAWLAAEGGTLGFTTYQSSRLFLLSAGDGGELVALERVVGSAMGLTMRQSAMWVANKEQVWRFSNVGPFTVAEQPYQALFMPRRGHLLGPCDTHDLLENVQFRGRHHELLFANTNFDCIASLDPHYGFVPVWQPAWVSERRGGDKSHLNGIGARDGRLAFATACARSDEPMGWRKAQEDGGVVLDVETGTVLCDGLSMPHSPRWHDDRLWLLNSGTGDFGWVDTAAGRFKPVALCAGFARGLCFVGGYAVIGLSRLRPNTFSSRMPLRTRLETLKVSERCGLLVVDPATGRTEHWLSIEGGVTELYDVAFVPGLTRVYTPGFSEPALHRRIQHRPV